MIFIDACFGEKTPRTPVWLMRQAGRYLKEYRDIRKNADSFLSLCEDPNLACDITLQPINILDVDAAILFSDILVVPKEMGMKLEFKDKKGPFFKETIKSDKDILKLKSNAYDYLDYVYDTIGLVKTKLDNSKALIGFCGSPWTLAVYMVEGESPKTRCDIKKYIYQNPSFLHSLLKKLTYVLEEYLKRQIEAGADAIMIFDSWSIMLQRDDFFNFSWVYNMQISSYLKKLYPHIPIIIFERGVGGYLKDIHGSFNVFGVDWSLPMELARDILGSRYVIQGNMDPFALYDKDAIKKYILKTAEIMRNHNHIFNLGHGILPDTPLENVKYFVDFVKKVTADKP